MMVKRVFLIVSMMVHANALLAMVLPSAGSVLTGALALGTMVAADNTVRAYSQGESHYLQCDTEKKVPLEPCIAALGLFCTGVSHCSVAPRLKQMSMKARLHLVKHRIERPYFYPVGRDWHVFEGPRFAKHYKGVKNPHDAAMSDLRKGYASLLKVHHMLERQQILQASSHDEAESKIKEEAEQLDAMIRVHMRLLDQDREGRPYTPASTIRERIEAEKAVPEVPASGK